MQTRFKHNKKTAIACWLTMLCLLFSLSIRSQVTIGDATPPQKFSILEIVSNETGGLRLPQLTTNQRQILEASSAFQTEIVNKGKGLTIYNTTTNCVEYWNKIKWISLCSSSTAFEGGDCATAPIPSTGGSVDCQVTDPNCLIPGNYTFTIVNGSAFATLTVTDAGTGKFTLTFTANDWASDRQAIVMVTSPCGTSSLLAFTQQGDPSGCGMTTVPDISSIGDLTTMCADGAVYLYLNGYPTTGIFIWTLNGQEVGRGYNYTATVPGKYIVYGDKIGCSNSKSIQITLDGTGAPKPVKLIVVGNNGEACGVGGTVELVVSTPSSGTVIWFCDGKLTAKTGTRISATKGYWEAVVQEGSCRSVPLGVTVTENTTGGSMLAPVMKINGLTSGWKLCKGGSLVLEVATIEQGVTYTWYADNTPIGVGSRIYYPIPSASQVVIRLRATGTGCAQEAMSVETIGVDQAPMAPIITSNTSGNVLCGGQATLSTTGGDSYIWFKDGSVVPGQVSSFLEISKTGSYRVVAVSADGCQSIQSKDIVITISDFATVRWVNCPLTVNAGDTKTYSVSLDFPQGATYNWKVGGNAIITNGQGTSSVTVYFPKEEVVSITCEAANGCGMAIDSPLTEDIAVGAACTDVTITNTSSLTSSIKEGQNTSLSVTANGINLIYQWYEGTIGLGSPIPNAKGAIYEYKGIQGRHDFYCVVSVVGGKCLEAVSPQFSVTVTADPSALAAGTGTFVGKTCFDIAYGNDNLEFCGSLSGRQSQKTNFDLRTPQNPNATGPYTGVQVYTFASSGTVSNVRFDYVDKASGKVVESMVPNDDYTGNIASGTVCKVTVSYKSSLNLELRTLTRLTALKVDLYVIYNDQPDGKGSDRTLKLAATFQDCACCGAATSSGGWLSFMCHNLGADESLDPFRYVSKNQFEGYDIKGDLYQWGRPKDGHEKRTSKVTSTLATTNTPGNDLFIYDSLLPTYDWREGISNLNTYGTRWGDGTQNVNQPKAANDPCPNGWKVPSNKQWMSIYTNENTPNKWVWSSNGFMVGEALFLPAAGIRQSSLGTESTHGHYWSSTVYEAYNNYYSSHYMYFFNFAYGKGIYPGGSGARSKGMSIRCVSE